MKTVALTTTMMATIAESFGFDIVGGRAQA